MHKLKIGSKGPKVKQLQLTLNAWMLPPYNRLIYPVLPRLRDDGLFGPVTQERLRGFQQLRLLPRSGEVDFPTLFALNPVAKFKLDLRPTLRSLKPATENPLWKQFPPLSEKSDSPASGGKEDGQSVELKTVSGRTLLKSGEIALGDLDWEAKQQFEAEFASIDLGERVKLGFLGAFTPESRGPKGTSPYSLEFSAQFSLVPVWKKGAFEVAPSLTLGLESERFRNLALKATSGLTIDLKIPRLKGGILSLEAGIGGAVDFPLAGDDRRPTVRLDLETSLNFKLNFPYR